MTEIPSEFGKTLLGFAFLLLLAPYFSGKDFGLLKIPEFSNIQKKKIKLFGPLFFLLSISTFIPFFPAFSFSPTHKVQVVGEGYLNLRSSPKTQEELEIIAENLRINPASPNPGFLLTLYNNTLVQVLNDSADKWTFIRVRDGTKILEGYVAKRFRGQPTLVSLAR
ncbi:MAG: SH3 domain-containing protein [Candidatus Contendobacter sp.]|nr:SH3 domain-containing protein [Candidatus Contendobacter sp.]